MCRTGGFHDSECQLWGWELSKRPGPGTDFECWMPQLTKSLWGTMGVCWICQNYISNFDEISISEQFKTSSLCLKESSHNQTGLPWFLRKKCRLWGVIPEGDNWFTQHESPLEQPKVFFFRIKWKLLAEVLRKKHWQRISQSSVLSSACN